MKEAAGCRGVLAVAVAVAGAGKVIQLDNGSLHDAFSGIAVNWHDLDCFKPNMIYRSGDFTSAFAGIKDVPDNFAFQV